MPQPFLLLIAANLALAGFLGWKWSLWSVPAWLEEQRSKVVFFLTLYDSINDMKYFWNCLHHTSALSQPFYLLIAANLAQAGFLGWNGAYGLCRLGWRYSGAKLSFSWPYMIVSMIWNTSEISALHLIRSTAILVVDWCQFGPSWIFGLKMELMVCAGWGVMETVSEVFHYSL